MIKIKEKKGFLKNEMSRLKNIRFLSGITYGEFEEMSEEDKEFNLS